MNETRMTFDLVDADGHRIMSVTATSGHEARDLFKARLEDRKSVV